MKRLTQFADDPVSKGKLSVIVLEIASRVESQRTLSTVSHECSAKPSIGELPNRIWHLRNDARAWLQRDLLKVATMFVKGDDRFTARELLEALGNLRPPCSAFHSKFVRIREDARRPEWRRSSTLIDRIQKGLKNLASNRLLSHDGRRGYSIPSAVRENVMRQFDA